MARQTAEIAGISEAVFSAHAHSYRKITQLLVDSVDTWGTPQPVDVVDDDTVHQQDLGQDLEAVGVTVATEPTSTPV